MLNYFKIINIHCGHFSECQCKWVFVSTCGFGRDWETVQGADLTQGLVTLNNIICEKINERKVGFRTPSPPSAPPPSPGR